MGGKHGRPAPAHRPASLGCHRVCPSSQSLFPPSFNLFSNPSPRATCEASCWTLAWATDRYGGLGHGQTVNTTNTLFQSKGHEGENGAARDQGCAGLRKDVARGGPDTPKSREHPSTARASTHCAPGALADDAQGHSLPEPSGRRGQLSGGVAAGGRGGDAGKVAQRRDRCSEEDTKNTLKP